MTLATVLKPLLFGLLAGWAAPAFPQIDISRLIEPQNTRVRDIAAASDGGLWLLLSRRNDSRGSENSIVKLSSDLRIEFRQDLRAEEIMAIVAFGSGLLISSRDRVGYALLFYEPETADAPRLVYRRTIEHDPRFGFATAPGSEAIYVVDKTGRYEYVIRRLDVTGREIWSRVLPQAQFRRLVVTANGPVVGHFPTGIYFDDGRRLMRFTAYTNAGETRWESELHISDTDVSGFTAFPPNRLALMPQAGRDELGSLAILDDNDGALLRELPLPRGSAGRRLPTLHPTADGLLMVAGLLGHPYLAHFGPDGEIQWWRRFRIDDSREAQPEVRALTDDRIAVVSVADTDTGAEERITVAFIDPESDELASSYGRCLQTDPMPIETLEQALLDEYGVRVVLPVWRADPTQRTRRIEACMSPSEEQYYEFLATFREELERRNAPRWDIWREAVVVNVVDLDLPYKLTDYLLNAPLADASGSGVSYYADPSGARAMAQHLVEELHPHVQTVKGTLATEFEQLTGHRLSFYDEQPLDERPSEFMGRIEAAAEEIVRQVNRLDDDELEVLRSKPWWFYFNQDGFGRDHQNLRPLAEINDELRAEINFDPSTSARP